MKKWITPFFFLCLFANSYAQVGIGTTSPSPKAVLDLTSTNKGFLIPRMTYTDRTGIMTPPLGLMVYQTNAVGLNQSGIYFYDGTNWKRIARSDETGGGGGSSGWTITGDDQYSNLAGEVGIGTLTPTSKLHVVGNILAETGSVTINHSTALLQLQSGGVNKAFMTLSGNHLRMGTSAGNTSGQLYFRINNISQMMIDSTGRVGMGTTSPDEKLEIANGSLQVGYAGTSGGVPHAAMAKFLMTEEHGKKGGLRFVRDGATLAEMMYTIDTNNPDYLNFSASGAAQHDLLINSSGRVGINMNGSVFNPSAQLHIRSDVNVDALAFHSSSLTESPTIQFYNTISGGNAGTKKAFIQLSDTEDLRLGTNGGNTNGKLILRMNGNDFGAMSPAGNFGLGILTPVAKLHIENGDDADPNPYVGNGYILLGGIGQTNLVLDNNEILARNGLDPATLTLQNDAGDLRVGSSNRLFVGSNGYVGIGTGNPLAKLDVNGAIRTTGNGTSIALDGNDPNIGYWWNGAFRSWTGQYSNHFKIASNNQIRIESTNQINMLCSQVAIGDINNDASQYKLSVKGKIICEELKVEVYDNWPDYVFKTDYALRPIADLKSFVTENQHLPNIPKAADIEKTGFEVGDMNRKLLEKVEELTLYVIQLQDQINELKEGSHPKQ